jgi:hypothetical protein
MSESIAAIGSRTPYTHDRGGRVSGAVIVPALHQDDRPLVIVLHPTGHVRSGSPRIGWVVVGYLDTDEHGGTRTPVVLSGTDLGLAPVPAEAETMLALSGTLCTFLVSDVDHKIRVERSWWSEDPLSDYTAQQWDLLEQEYERLQCHAEAASGDSGEVTA